MPTVTNAKLILKKAEVGTDITIEVTYDVNFSRLESNLAPGSGLGVTFRELVQLLGIDPPGSRSGTSIHLLGIGQLLPLLQDAPQTLHRRHTRTVTRASLDEDPGLIAADNDELQARIRVLVQGLPKDTINEFTNQVVLKEAGGIVSSASAAG